LMDEDVEPAVIDRIKTGTGGLQVVRFRFLRWLRTKNRKKLSRMATASKPPSTPAKMLLRRVALASSASFERWVGAIPRSDGAESWLELSVKVVRS
jgi:hypothetical protein